MRKRRSGKRDREKKTPQDNVRVVDHVQTWFTPLRCWAIGLAVAACFIQSMHVAALFENDRFFSHLSPLERELSFRTEMGLYYSYYKRIVEAPTLSVGVASILRDNKTEYPTTINTLERFNLYPEVCLSVMYRSYRWMLAVLGMTGSKCVTISRGHGQSSIEACNGLGDPAYFYVHITFALSGLLASAIALIGTYVSGSVWGGVVSLSAFFYNHGHATRVMWTPPLRESFAMPFILLQQLILCHTIRQKTFQWQLWSGLVLVTVAFLLPWQFSQFTLLTQILSVLVVYCLRLISPHTFLHILSAIAVAFGVSVLLQFGNTMMLISFLPACLLACTGVCLMSKLSNYLKYLPIIMVAEVSVVICVSVIVKMVITSLLEAKEDEHIISILLSKFTSYQDFHTRLYTCSPEFDFLPISYVLDITWTLLLPVAVVVMAMVGVKMMRRVFEATAVSDDVIATPTDDKTGDLGVQVYHVMQALAYVVMATLIMRLKLFLTPQLAVLCGFLPALLRGCERWRGKWVVAGLLILSSVKGWHNLYLQHDIIGEYNNPAGEELVLWIQDHTPQSAVFAGTMPTMAAVLLTTGRPIVNHPHYEQAGLRNRTKHVYTIFSHKPVAEIHSILHGMGVDYVISEDGWCRRARHRPGCSFSDIWDEEDPANQGRPVFCEELQHHTPPPFVPAFSNSVYRVLHVN